MSQFEKQAGDVTERLAALIRRQQEDQDPGPWELYQNIEHLDVVVDPDAAEVQA